jgi:hypothetical protein
MSINPKTSPMARPRKPRTVDGVPLADNLYPDARGRPGRWRYRRADGSDKLFQASTVAEANRLAEEANGLRHRITPSRAGKASPGRDALAYHAPLYIAYRERLDPSLAGKQSWTNRKYAIEQLAEHITAPLGQINRGMIQSWWDDLTPAQQKLRHAEFRRWFNWLSGQGLLPRLDFNPFTTADDRPRLLLKSTPAKRRQPLTLDAYWRVYHQAGEMGYPGLQIAMALSLYTTYRREDIVTLRWDTNLAGRKLRLVIGKSEAQKGTARAARHEWDLDAHPPLSRIIARARELSLQHQRCTYIVSQMPRRKHKGPDGAKANRDHIARILPERLTRMYAEVAEAAGVHGTSFHEVRGLSSALHRLAGYSTEEIQSLMAHESKTTTLGYQDGHDLPYSRMDMVLPEGVIGGEW